MSKKKRAKTRPAERQPLPAESDVSTDANPIGAIKWPAVLAVVEPLSIAALYFFLLTESWLRWMDPMIDFPRDLYLAWRMSEGALLYMNVANWYGPLAQLVQGAAFKLFGVGIDTMIWTNIALTAAVVILLRDIFRNLGNRLSGWLAAVVFLVVFAFGNYTNLANFNFLAPYVAQATYSFAGLVVVLWGLVHHLKSERSAWLGVAGLGLAVAYLDKPEALLAALGSLGVYFMVRFIQVARVQAPAGDWRGARRWAKTTTLWLAGGFFSLWLPVFLYFGIRGGLRYAILATDFAPYTVVVPRFLHTLMAEHSQVGFLGFDQPWSHFAGQLLSGALLVLICGVMALAARAWTRMPKQSAGWYAMVGLVVAAGGLGDWLAETHAIHWLDIGAAFVFPVILAAAGMVTWSLWAGWTGRGDWKRALGLAVVGMAAALMLARMVLNGRIYQFGFFMMPLAALWLVHLMVVEAARPAVNGLRANRLLPGAFSVFVLAGVAVLGQASFQRYATKNFEVGEGRDHFYTFGPEIMFNGQLFKDVEAAFKTTTPQARSLMVIPEGIAVNYHLRIPSSLAEMDFLPPALAYADPSHILGELTAHPPESIIFCTRDFSEFGAPYFGANERNGRSILLWINDHYWLAGVQGHGEKITTITHDIIDVVIPRPPGLRGVALLRDAHDAPLAPENIP